MDWVADYLLFLAKSITVVIAVLAVVGGSAAIAARARRGASARLRAQRIDRGYEHMRRTLESALTRGEKVPLFRRLRRRRANEEPAGGRRRLFVLDFQGDLRASAVQSLRREVTAVLTVARPEDEVVVRLESAGGLIPHYGLAASQLARLRERRIPLTICVDRIAASGGYLMASVGDRLLAAPFAVVGSLGVIAQFPNFHRLLKRHDIDFEQFMAGPYKRTVTLFGENSEEGREKFRAQIDEAYQLLKAFVGRYRPQLDIERVATGEHWYGTRALELGLVDALRTSDDYLLEASRDADIVAVSCPVHRPWRPWS